eukprot:CAMPEP_0178435224 /NCGR_PEP_ID=MMETSP0689_2-20121128/33820_1 /TAXON_ID=160604 /ORGANISM="Amphidinium massartii, Strain CS-259" /LENGTH=584 /DNA_ID=CAMNT_0020057295 /DNA_START=87 /DNA_END=1841 /DNA_ORIENTATION=+
MPATHPSSLQRLLMEMSADGGAQQDATSSSEQSGAQFQSRAMMKFIARNAPLRHDLAVRGETQMRDRVRRQVELAQREEERRAERAAARAREQQERQRQQQQRRRQRQPQVAAGQPVILHHPDADSDSTSTEEGSASLYEDASDSSRSSTGAENVEQEGAKGSTAAEVPPDAQGPAMARRPTMQRESGSTWAGPISDAAATEASTDGYSGPPRRQTMAACTAGTMPMEKLPRDVQTTLDVSHVVDAAANISVAPSAALDSSAGCPPFRLVGSGCSIPSPEKGGEAVYAALPMQKGGGSGADSFYFDTESSSFGVADGVGEWEWRFKLSARAFADELMEGSKQAAVRVDASASRNLGAAATEMMQSGFDCTKSFGAATAIVAKLGNESDHIGLSCVGDSGLMLFRPETIGRHTSYSFVSRTKEQQHQFNMPFQLSRLPEPADYFKLMHDGMGALVAAATRMEGKKVDEPSDADQYSWKVERGDLLVMGSDGLFDNLYQKEIQDICDCATSPFDVDGLGGSKPTDSTHPLEEELASRLAIALAQAAFLKSIDKNGNVPFNDHAKKVNVNHTGGKTDDITCVCAWVV